MNDNKANIYLLITLNCLLQLYNFSKCKCGHNEHYIFA